MAPIASAELIAELERTVQAHSPARCAQMLHRVTDLLVAKADRLNQRQFEVFDEILMRLTDHVELQTMAQLSHTLAELGSARLEIIRRLAYHQEAAVAAPLLQKSRHLPEADLAEIVECRSAAHALAISKRNSISETVSGALLNQGDTAVCVQLTKNAGARFSLDGYSKLAVMAERNDELADLLVGRADVPTEILCQLLTSLPRSVRARLLEIAAPELRDAVQAAIESVEAGICSKAPERVDYSEALAKVLELNKAGKLSDSTVKRFATWREYRNLIAALSQLAMVPIETIEPLLHDGDCYGLTVACRASRLNWNMTQAVIRNPPDQRKPSASEVEQAKAAFESLNLSATQRIIRFGSVREFALKFQPNDDAAPIAGAV